jgi:hypothetical protein
MAHVGLRSVQEANTLREAWSEVRRVEDEV